MSIRDRSWTMLANVCPTSACSSECMSCARVALARTTRPASVSVAMPIVAPSNAARKRSRCSATTVSFAGATGFLSISGRDDGCDAALRSRSGSSPMGSDFSMKSAAPSARARSASPAGSKPENMSTRVSGHARSTPPMASRPSISGMDTSSSMRSGRCRTASATASLPVDPSPTMSNPPAVSSRRRTSARRSAASSTSTVRRGRPGTPECVIRPVRLSNERRSGRRHKPSRARRVLSAQPCQEAMLSNRAPLPPAAGNAMPGSDLRTTYDTSGV